ncbi:MAG TPA: hypothetical protein VFT41_00325, partial [Gemmatimonadaceae bacterium]|nr:hypothetical protein [Gemmatimonadaceae bacterium]
MTRWVSSLALAAGVSAATAGFAPTARAQAPHDAVASVQSWIRLPAAPGHERFATDRIQAADPGWTRDALGNLVKTRGTGSPVRVVACGLDAPAYVVSEIRDDGYLRVQMDGNGPRRLLWDQFNEGQRVFVMTANRATPGKVQMVPGVFGVRSTHLWRGRTPHDGPTTIEDLWLDVGARSRAEVAKMGIQMLDPVFRDMVPWQVGDEAVGPEAGARAGCAAVAAVSHETPKTGTTVFVISVQSGFSNAGLLGVLARTPSADSVWYVGAAGGTVIDSEPGIRGTALRLALPAAVHVGSAAALAPDVSNANTLIEGVGPRAMDALLTTTSWAAGVNVPTAMVTPNATLPFVAEHRDSLTPYADLLARLT